MTGPKYFEDRIEPDKKLFIDANTTIPLSKRFVIVDASSGSPEITFPNVSKAEGYEFVISAAKQAGSESVDLVMSDGLASALTTSISTAGIQVVAKSDGRDWHVERS